MILSDFSTVGVNQCSKCSLNRSCGYESTYNTSLNKIRTKVIGNFSSRIPNGKMFILCFVDKCLTLATLGLLISMNISKSFAEKFLYYWEYEFSRICGNSIGTSVKISEIFSEISLKSPLNFPHFSHLSQKVTNFSKIKGFEIFRSSQATSLNKYNLCFL